MKQNDSWGWIITLSFTVVFATFAILSNTSYYNGTGVGTKTLLALFGVSLYFLVTGFINLNNNPPHLGVITKWGKRLWHRNKDTGDLEVIYITEGYNWIFLRWIMYNIIYINMKKIDIDFATQDLLTPDGGEVNTGCSMNIIPNSEYIVNYITSGKEAGVRKLIVQRKEEALRVWAEDPNNEVKTYKDLLKAKKPAVAVIVKAISMNQILSNQQIENLVNNGQRITIPDLGIDILSLNLTTMHPHGEIWEADKKSDVEKKQRTGESYEIETDMLKASEILKQKVLLKRKLKTEHNIDVSEADLEEHFDKVMTLKKQRELTLESFVERMAKAIKGGKP